MKIREIAKQIGVSPSTISCVLNSRSGVSDERRAFISDLLIKNGYTIKSADSKQQRSILLIRYKSSNHLSDSSDTFFTRIVEGIESTCQALEYSLSLSIANHNTLPSIFSRAIDNGTCGILFLGSEYELSDTSILKNSKLPLVAIDNRFLNDAINCVDMDNREGIFAAIQLLHTLGHREIGYGMSLIQIGSMAERTHAYYEALRTFNLECKPSYVADLSPFSKLASEQFLKYLHKQKTLPTAYIAGNDTIAAGMMKALHEFGLNVPNDISLIGFDDNDICKLLSPQLTTLKINNFEIGRQAVYRLHQLIIDKDSSITRTSVSVKLMVRGSVKDISKKSEIN